MLILMPFKNDLMVKQQPSLIWLKPIKELNPRHQSKEALTTTFVCQGFSSFAYESDFAPKTIGLKSVFQFSSWCEAPFNRALLSELFTLPNNSNYMKYIVLLWSCTHYPVSNSKIV